MPLDSHAHSSTNHVIHLHRYFIIGIISYHFKYGLSRNANQSSLGR